MKTTIILFTYRGEEELLPLQASHLAKVLPFASVHIISAHCTHAFTTRKASSTEAATLMEVSASWAC